MRNKGKIIVLLIGFLLSLSVNTRSIDFNKIKKSLSFKNLFHKSGDKNLETKALFLQSKYQRIELPPEDTLTSVGGQHVVTEQVTYKHEDNTLTNKNNQTVAKGKINEVQHLNEVVVKAKSRFAPEHNGVIDVDFIINVPQELISPKWKITLMPKLLHNDSLVNLQPIIIKGTEFRSAQINDSLKYAKYLASIIDESKYDSAFLDKEAVRENMQKYQKAIYEKYVEDWNQHKEFVEKGEYYNKKDIELERKHRIYEAKKKAQIGKKAFDNKYKKRLENKSSASAYGLALYEHQDEMKKEKKKYQKEKEALFQKKLDYRTTSFALQDTPNDNFTYQDSVELAKNFYDFEQIVDNEIKDEQKGNVKKKIVRFEDAENARLDTIVAYSTNFSYYYKQQYPAKSGLKKVRILMDAKVEAMDQSGYYSPPVDTLSYFIASMAQLADTSLVYKVSKLKKTAYNKVTAFLKFPKNKNSKFNVKYGDNQNQLLNALLFLDAVKKNKSYAVDSVSIEVYRSLEGNFDDNAVISTQQASAVRDYFESQYKGTEFANHFVASPQGEDWNTFVREIRSSDKISNKDAILEAIANAKYPDKTKKEIRTKFKSDYAVIQKEIFPYMNKTDIVFYVHRTDMTQERETRREYQGNDYTRGLKLLQNKEYWRALKLLAPYGDYNTALCLTCLGYNGKAYELLEKLPKTGNTLYLKAIVAKRLNKNQEAISNLQESVKLDPSKKYRIGLDAEAKAIAAECNLN